MIPETIRWLKYTTCVMLVEDELDVTVLEGARFSAIGVIISNVIIHSFERVRYGLRRVSWKSPILNDIHPFCLIRSHGQTCQS